MAVSLPSDLVVDVMRNADPARLNTATAKLRALETPQDGAAFASVVGRMGGIEAHAGSPALSGAAPDAYVEFERMVLRNLFESLLPVAESGAFGTGPSAGIWRSLAADQLAGLYAGSGGIGIASAIAAEEKADGGGAQPQWPYFSMDKIEAFSG